MPTPTSTRYYLPLLETKSGVLHLNNTGTHNTMSFETYNGLTPVEEPLNIAVKIADSSDALFQGRLSLVYNSGYTLAYNGGVWGDRSNNVTPSSFRVDIEYKDMAWAVLDGGNFVADLFPITSPTIIPPNPPTGPTYSYSGGSKLSFDVVPLVWPEINSISPASIRADDVYHDVTFTLKRPLNAIQAPTVTVAGTGLTIDPAGVRANKDIYGSITGWVVGIKTPPQVSSYVAMQMSASETLEYLQVTASPHYGVKSTATAYMSNSAVGTLEVVGSTGPLSVSAVVMGSETSDGWVSTLNGVTSYAGTTYLLARVSSPTNNFKEATFIAQQNGFTSRFNLGAAVPSGNSTGTTPSGGLVYYQDYTLTIDTGVLLSEYAVYDIGISATSTDLNTSTIWANNTFLNCNLSRQFVAYEQKIFEYHDNGLRTTWHTFSLPSHSWEVNGVVDRLEYPVIAHNGTFFLKPTNALGLLKAELYISGPLWSDHLVATALQPSATDPSWIEFPAISSLTWLPSNYVYYFKLYSLASGYVIDGNAGYIITPPQPFWVGGWNTGCFSTDTFTMTVDGPKKISEITKGRYLLTIPEAEFLSGNLTGKLSAYPVDAVMQHQGSFDTLNLNGIITTKEHPWASSNFKFESASEVEKVMVVDLTDSTLTPVAAIKLDGPVLETVHNLSVKDASTFLVSPTMFGPWSLVHNKPPYWYTLYDLFGRV